MDRQPDAYPGANLGGVSTGGTAASRPQGPGTQRPGAGGAAGETSGQQSGGMVDQARDTVRHLAWEAQEHATDRVRGGVDQGKARVAGTLGSVARTLRQSTQQLRAEDETGASQYIERAADQMDRLATYLQNTNVGEMVDQVEDVARRQPVLFLGGAFVLGLAGARFLKSSRRGHVQQGSGRDYRLQAGAGRGAHAPSYGGSSSGGDRDVTRARDVARETAQRQAGFSGPSAPGASATGAGRAAGSGLAGGSVAAGSGLGGSALGGSRAGSSSGVRDSAAGSTSASDVGDANRR